MWGKIKTMVTYSLKKFQEDFVEKIAHKKFPKTLSGIIVPSLKMRNKEKAISVYESGYKARLTEALGETFEACWWALGDNNFFEVCYDFISCHNSLVYNLSNYGQEFPEFLRRHKLSQEIPFIFNLAYFEWSFKNLFHKEQHKPISREELAQLSHIVDFKVVLSKAIFIFESDFSIYEIWKQRKLKNPDRKLNISKPVKLLLYKKNSLIYVDEVSKKEISLLKNFQQGFSLGEALNKINLVISAEELSEVFQKMMAREIIKDLII